MSDTPKQNCPACNNDCTGPRKLPDDRRFFHYCDEWDGLEIDETCSEFACCTCDFEGEELEAKQARDWLRDNCFWCGQALLKEAAQ